MTRLMTYAELAERLPGVSMQALRATMNRLRLGSKIGRMRYFTEDDFTRLLDATRTDHRPGHPPAKAHRRTVTTGEPTTDEVLDRLRQRQIERRQRRR